MQAAGMHIRRLGLAAASALALLSMAANAHAQATSFNIPTGAPSSPLFGARPFTQELMLFEEFGTQPVSGAACANCAPLPPLPDCTGMPNGAQLDTFMRQPLWPASARAANTTNPNPWAAMIGTCVGALATSSAEGRPPGDNFSDQSWQRFPSRVWFSSVTTGARTNGGLRDAWQRHHFAVGEFAPSGLYYHNGTNAGTEVRFHPNFPAQGPNAVWTFDGTMPPKLLMARYGEPVLFRHYNGLPVDPAANGGFGMHTLSTHEHNGHNPAESDGFTSSYFFPGQYYDYHWPMILAGHDHINTTATDPHAAMAGSPNTRIPGDWHETMSTHWFHDHMLDYTAQNVYKGSAAMMNYYSAVDPGREGVAGQSTCNYENAANVNLCLPSGSALPWGNRDYDVNLVIADKAWDAQGQLFFNIFNTDGFLGDRVLVNWSYMPYMQVRARRYRFRILNGSVSRYYKLALVTAAGQRVPFYMIANDGNIMENAVAFPNAQSQDLPEQGIAERYDIVVDFSQFSASTKLYLVNTLEHQDGRGPSRVVPLNTILNGSYRGDPGVGKIMEFRVVRYTGTDRSMNPAQYVAGQRTMIPRPTATPQEIAGARHRTFEFGRANGSDNAPWTIRTDGGQGLNMDPHRVSAAPTENGWEIWHIRNGGSGWSHPVHVHFEEGQILARGGVAPPVWEAGARKDVYRIGDLPDSTSSVDVLVRFREFLGTYMEHCHNTQHEDHSMLLRWDNRSPGQAVAIPTPIPTWEGVLYEPSFGLPPGG